MYKVIPTILIATHTVFTILIIIFNKYSIYNPHTGRGGGQVSNDLWSMKVNCAD